MKAQNRLQEYLKGERASAIALLLIGILSAAIAFFMNLFLEADLGQGLMISIFCLSALQLLRGGIQFRQAQQLSPELPFLLNTHPHEFYQKEDARTEKQARKLNGFILAETIILALGISMALWGSIGQENSFSVGLGVGCMVQSALLIVHDIYANLRLGLYRDFLSLHL